MRILVIASVSLLALPFAALAQPKETPIQCAASISGSPFSASYSVTKAGITPAMVDVIFRGQRPSSAQAEGIVRSCLDVVLTRFGRSSDVMATAWYSTTGRSDDHDMVPLRDGSNHLVFDTKRGPAILTWKQREGTQTVTKANTNAGYFVNYEEHNVIVRPGEKFAMLDVVFTKVPDRQTIYQILVEELKKAVAKQPQKLTTTAFAKTGVQSNPASQQQIHGTGIAYMNVEFDPKTGKFTDEQGRLVQ